MGEKHTTYFNLLDALKEGCPICFLVKRSVHKFMDDFLYEGINDPGVRQEIKASSGFCNRHAWQLQKSGDGFGQAIVYSELMNVVLKRPAKTCIFCVQEKEAEGRYLSVFLESFDDTDFGYRYKSSFGLCLPHLAVALKKCRDAGAKKALVDIETKKVSALTIELKEFMRKHDHRFSHEKIGKEGDSWIRAIEKFIGKEGIH